MPAKLRFSYLALFVSALPIDGCKEQEAKPKPNIVSVTPSSGAVNSIVSIEVAPLGIENSEIEVLFNGSPGEIISKSGQTIYSKVPERATTGPVTISVDGVTSNGVPFEVIKEVMYAGGGSMESGYAVAVDAFGNTYVAGSFWSAQIRFGKISLFGRYEDGFIAKYNPQGDIIWIKQLTGSDAQRITSIAIDNQNNIFIGGYIAGKTTLGILNVDARSWDAFVARLSDDGTPLWIKSFGSIGVDYATSIALGSDENLLVTGGFAGQMAVGNSMLDVAGQSDAFVLNFRKDSGELIWAKSFGGLEFDGGRTIASNSTGIYVGGNFAGEVTIPGLGSSLSSKGQSDGFITKLSPAGDWIWAKQMGSSSSSLVASVVIDSNGDCIAGGAFTNDVNPGTPSNSKGHEDIFLTKLQGSTGDMIWAKTAGGINYDMLTSLALDDQNNIYATGYISGIASLDDLEAGSDEMIVSIFAAKYSSLGEPKLVRTAGRSTFNTGNSIAIDRNKVIYVTGFYREISTTFGTTEVPNAGSDDIFLWKIRQNLN